VTVGLLCRTRRLTVRRRAQRDQLRDMGYAAAHGNVILGSCRIATVLAQVDESRSGGPETAVGPRNTGSSGAALPRPRASRSSCCSRQWLRQARDYRVRDGNHRRPALFRLFDGEPQLVFLLGNVDPDLTAVEVNIRQRSATISPRASQSQARSNATG